MTPGQLATATATVLLAAVIASAIPFRRGDFRRWTYPVLCLAAAISITAWTNFGRFQTIPVDVNHSDTSPTRPKVRQHRPFHFHEFVHYYLGPKYFAELGYLGLYDCIALADSEIAQEDGSPKRISGWVRNLSDVLTDKPYRGALSDCTNEQRPRFSAARWSAFKNDLRELAHLTDDGAWRKVVYDAGFNPPPSLILVSGAVTNLVPIRAGELPTYLVATSLDLLLLVVGFFVFRSAFGRTTAVVAVVYFGATFISHYTWNGGSVLRFTWFVSTICALAMMKREQWVLAGALLGAAACDRLFPAAFAAFALVPIAVRARRSLAHRAILTKFALGFGATAFALVLGSLFVFGAGAWGTFFSRIARHGDVYFGMHIGLKKVLTFRDWVPAQQFGGHEGLMRFRDWNFRLRDTWSAMRPLVLPMQALIGAATVWACAHRRPYEAAILGGVVFMFFFNLPANYYYVILTPIPALLFRAAATAPVAMRRYENLAAFAAFNLFWMFTFVVPRLSPDVIVYNFYLCCAALFFLLAWITAWTTPVRRQPRLAPSEGPS